jgi:hypothetical protein
LHLLTSMNWLDLVCSYAMYQYTNYRPSNSLKRLTNIIVHVFPWEYLFFLMRSSKGNRGRYNYVWCHYLGKDKERKKFWNTKNRVQFYMKKGPQHWFTSFNQSNANIFFLFSIRVLIFILFLFSKIMVSKKRKDVYVEQLLTLFPDGGNK